MSTRRHQARQRGTTCVEFAFVAPVLFMIVLATIELWRINMIMHLADQAAYEAARTLVVPGAVAANGITIANEVMAVAGATNVTVTVTPATITDSTDMVTVLVRVPTAGNGWVVPKFYTAQFIESTITLNRETVE